MTKGKHADEKVLAAIQRTLLDLREANEKLVLATIHAQEMNDEAEKAAHLAEEAARKAEAARQLSQVLAEGLEESVRELRVEAELREKLIGIVSHDLRSPLQAIAISTYLLEEHGTLSVTDAKLVERARNSAQRMARMIAALLEFTRARVGGGLTLDLKPTNFRQVCGPVIEELAIGSGAQVHSDIRGELTGTWDADRLAQVLSNIIGNAIDHATAGTAALITAWESGGDILVEISNQGAAIPPELLPVIFQPFRRGQHQRQSKVRHLGLGLYISNQVVLAHGGELSARSEEGTTTFLIRLPRFPDLVHAPPDCTAE